MLTPQRIAKSQLPSNYQGEETHNSFAHFNNCEYFLVISVTGNGRGRMSVKAGVGGGGSAPGSFLTMEEAGLVEMANIDMHEKFLCRLTVRKSSHTARSYTLLACTILYKRLRSQEIRAGKQFLETGLMNSTLLLRPLQ